MKVVINNEQTNNKPLKVEECFFTGKHKLEYDGSILQEQSKNSFKLNNAKSAEDVTVKGHQIWGVSVNLFGNNIQVSSKLTWYEIVLSVLIFAPCLMFGWVGLLFGLVLALAGFVTIRILDNLVYKIVTAVLLLVIAMLLSYIFGVFVFKMFFFFM